jgi:hypothetical protein
MFRKFESRKFDRSIYLAAALVSGVMLSASAGQVMANPVPVQLNPTIALA